MKYLLKDIQDYMENDDGFRQRAAGYTQHMKQLQFMGEAITIIKGIIMADMLSFKDTNLDAYEKDTLQRTYYNIIQILDFLQNPEQWFRKKNKIKLAYSNTAEKFKRQFTSGGKNG